MIIDRYISWEIIRPFATGLGLLILIFIGFIRATTPMGEKLQVITAQAASD